MTSPLCSFIQKKNKAEVGGGHKATLTEVKELLHKSIKLAKEYEDDSKDLFFRTVDKLISVLPELFAYKEISRDHILIYNEIKDLRVVLYQRPESRITILVKIKDILLELHKQA